MRTSRMVSGFASWRWMPCCALITGSLLYVALIVLVVPNSLGKLPHTLSTPVGPQNDMLTSNALGNGASLSSHHPGTPAARLPPTQNADDAPVAPRQNLVGSRAAALGSPVMRPEVAPPPEPPPAPPPPPEEPEPEPAAPEAEDPPPAPPHPVVQRFMGGVHMIAPHLMAAPADNDQPADEGDNGGGNSEDDDNPQ